jgi:hypothetical protein
MLAHAVENLFDLANVVSRHAHVALDLPQFLCPSGMRVKAG